LKVSNNYLEEMITILHFFLFLYLFLINDRLGTVEDIDGLSQKKKEISN